jgi:hypothetical protein
MTIAVPCPACDNENQFEQDHAVHAGFSEVGFLYNEAGNLTLIWGVFDPAYTAIVGSHNPWRLASSQQQALQEALLPSPAGDRWLFENPARCLRCSAPIAGPMSIEQIYFYVYPGSIWAYDGPKAQTLADHLRRLPSRDR